LLRNYGDFAIAALDVKDAVTGVALGENGFAFAVFCEALSFTYRFEKGLKLERHMRLHWPPIIPALERGKIRGRSLSVEIEQPHATEALPRSLCTPSP
jgi:hypothetical protein